MTDSTISITGHDAAVLYAALEIAIAQAEEVLQRNSKNSQPYRNAVVNLLAAYKQQRERLKAAFPVLS